MTKDRRYKPLSNNISTGYIKTLREIFDTLPKSVLAKDLGIDLTRFNKMIDDVERFSVKNLYKMADLLEVDVLVIMNLVHRQNLIDKKTKPKTKPKG